MRDFLKVTRALSDETRLRMLNLLLDKMHRHTSLK
jgi:hypothetical protein